MLLSRVTRNNYFSIFTRSSFSKALQNYNKSLTVNCGILGVGSNEFNQLSNASDQCLVPYPVQGLNENDNFVNIHTCRTHSLGITKEGKIWFWGTNNKHPGAALTSSDITKPINPPSLESDCVINAVTGNDFSLILSEDFAGIQRLYGTGSHELGQCGIGGKIGNSSTLHYPHTIGTFHEQHANNITQIAAGVEHCLALTSDGRIFSWGNGVEGQLGHGDGEILSLPKEIKDIPNDIKTISAGVDCSAAITLNGELYMWGSNEYGQLGIGSKEVFQSVPVLVKELEHIRIKSVHIGGTHTLAIDIDNNIYGWGSNLKGQLSLHDREEYYNPEIISSLNTKNIVDISCSYNHTACTSELGIVYTFGCGEYGKLGHGDTNDQINPKPIEFLKGNKVIKTVCGTDHTLFLVERN